MKLLVEKRGKFAVSYFMVDFIYFWFGQDAAAALAATEVAFMIQQGQRRGLHFTIPPVPAAMPGPAVNPPQEPVQ